MKPVQTQANRKRPVNLTLSEDLVASARSLTPNLSGVVESLLADYVAREQAGQTAKANKLKAAVSAWNDFNTRHGSFADEHSTL